MISFLKKALKAILLYQALLCRMWRWAGAVSAVVFMFATAQLGGSDDNALLMYQRPPSMKVSMAFDKMAGDDERQRRQSKNRDIGREDTEHVVVLT